MAKSPAHKFGQIIGDLLERTVEYSLREYTGTNPRLYLDKKGHRPARGTKKKVSWEDKNGNKHDLDFVIEWDGTPHAVGKPAAFIESAWRRYTKHSRNKSQEIQGAIEPLFKTYSQHCPFIGVVLGGIFTEGSLTQLKSLGFKILYFNYDSIVQAFAAEGINANYGEGTPLEDLKQKVEAFEALSAQQVSNIEARLREIKSDDLTTFVNELNTSINRAVERIIIYAIHGDQFELENVASAITFIQEYENVGDQMPLMGFEIFIRYNNGDRIEAKFQEKEKAIEFLNIV